MSYPTNELRWGNAPLHFVRHLTIMPGWHKVVLFVALVFGIVGGTGWFMNKAAATPGGSAVIAPGPSAARPQNSNGFGFTRDAAPSPSTPANPTVGSANPPPAPTPAAGFLANLSSPTMKIGISVLAGFILGWVFRAFLKTMALVAMLLFGLFAALSYFGVFNVDLTRAKAEYATAMQWATDQFWKLKDMLVAHLPSSSGGTVGAFLGFKRK